MLLIVAGCAVHKKSHLSISRDYQEMIAKFSDLPDAPFQAKLETIICSSTDHNQVQIFYTCPMSRFDLLLFYEQQMERLGWQLYAQSEVQDCLLHYNKPDRICSILLTGDKLIIYLGTIKGA